MQGDRTSNLSAISMAKGRNDAAGLLCVSQPQQKLAELIASPDLKHQLTRLINEQRFVTPFKTHGLSARRKVLLAGPPGTGKTYTASILAGELGCSLFQVRFDALMTPFMGESAAKLRQVFDAMHQVRGVYFFDEFDALGAQRTARNDVGEARRILSSFLQMLEQDDSKSLIVCATNHTEILDSALFRRFDDVMHYPLPTAADR